MDVYHSPEKFGLELIATVDHGASYEFDIFAVWTDNNKDNNPDGQKVYYATDSGCSCPSPFENYDSMETLTRVSNLAYLRENLKSWGADQTEIRNCLYAVTQKTGWL